MASKKVKSSKRLEAIKRSEAINKMLEDSTIEGEALLNSAGESRPSYESHVLDLLEKPEMKLEEDADRKPKAKKMARSKPKKGRR